MKKGKTTIAVLLCAALICSALFSSAAVFAGERAASNTNTSTQAKTTEETDKTPAQAKATKYDFGEWITKAELLVKNDQGTYVPVDNQTVAHDADARMRIEYAVTPKDKMIYPGDTFTYTLPSTFEIQKQEDGIVYDGSDKIGTYTISKERVITICLSDEFLSEDGRAGISGMISFDGNLNFAAGGTDTKEEIIKIGDQEITLNIKPDIKEDKANVKVEKSVTDKVTTGTKPDASKPDQSYDQTIKRMKYQLKITAPEDNTMSLTEIKVTDAFSTGKNYVSFDKGQLGFNKEKASGVTGVTPQWNDADKKVEFNVQGTMKAGDVLYITYWVDVDASIYLSEINGFVNQGITRPVKNDVKVITEEGTKAQASHTETFSKIYVWKNSSVEKDGRIKHVIHANERPVKDLTGWVFKDTLGDNQKFDPKAGVVVKKYTDGPEGQAKDLVGTETISLTEEQSSWEYEASGAYYYTFEYYTYPTKDNVAVKNTIKLYKKGETGKGYSYTTTITKNTHDLTKTLTSYDLTTGTFHWTSTLKSLESSGIIPKDAVYTDTLRVKQGNNWVEDNAKHWFDQGKLDLVVKDGNKKQLAEGTDYTFELTKKNAYKITFLEDVKAPVTITYASRGDFPKAENATYRNTGVLKVGSSGQWTRNADFAYKTSDYLNKTANNDFNVKDQTFSWKLTVNTKKAKFDDKTVELIDKLPEGLKFVSGEVTSKNGVNAEFTTSGKTITAKLTGISGKTATIKITTKVTDPDFFKKASKVSFVNTAWLRIAGTDWPEVQAAKQLEYYPLTKEGVYNGDTAPYADYKITVNKAGLKLSSDSGKVQLIDAMGPKMSLVPGTMEITNIETKQKLEAGKDYQLTISDKGFTLEIPDETPLEISYKVYIAEQPGATIELKNTATLQTKDVKVEVIEEKNNMTVQESKSTAAGDPTLKIAKGDAVDSDKKLQGAEFQLLKIKDIALGEEGLNESSNLEAVDGTFVTGSNGQLIFKNLSYDTYYCYKEVKAPAGYVVNSEPHAFIILKRNTEMKDVPEWVTKESSGVRKFVANDYGKLTVTKNFQSDGKDLTDGSYPDGVYYLSVFQDDKLVKVDGKPLTKAITVKDGKADKKSVEFRTPVSEKAYKVYETDQDGNKLTNKDNYFAASDHAGFFVSGQGEAIKITETDSEKTTAITNDQIKLTEKKVTKVWEGDENEQSKRPDSIKVQLYADGEKYGEAQTLDQNNSWTYTWEQLKEKNQEGEAIKYTVRELDQKGNAVEHNSPYDDNYVAAYDESASDTTITNIYYKGGYWSGSISVTKKVTMGDDAIGTDKVFYVGLYKDEELTKRVDGIKKLDMGGKASTTVTFSKLALNNTYYVAETDKQGNVITDAKGQLGCEMTIDNNKISLTKEKTEGAAQITNAFPDQYNFYIKKTSAHTGEALTGAEFTLYKDKDCKDEIVKATGDKDGKFAFKNLQKGTYYLKETKVPDGYYDTKKVYEVKIDKDGIAAIDGEAVKAEDKTYTIANTLTGSIKVTKEAKEDGLDTDVYKMTYYTALFSDKELTKRVSDVKALEMDGIHSTSVTFDGLKVGKTYYVAETDQNGKALPRQNDEGKWLVDYENQAVKLDPSSLNAESRITNSYYSDFYWSGSIDVTKLVTMGGDKAETNKVFYVGLYNDKDFTDRVGDIQTLKMNGKASTTVTFSDLPLNHTYYVAETDKDGTVITAEKAEQQGYKITVDNQKVSLTKENQIGTAKITNAFDDEHNFYIQKTTSHTGDALTGAEFTLFKDSNCTNKKVTVKGDDNGKFIFKNLMEGTYFLKETKVPEGYHDSEKVYTVVIDADGKAAIDGNAVNAEDKTYTIANTLAGKIKVTKDVKEDGIGTEDFGTYYTALFSDSGFQNRVTEVKAIEMKGSQSTSVTFDNLKANETYYVAETNAEGRVLPNENNELGATIAYNNQVVTLDANNLSAESKITNSFYSGYYWAGSIDVTKRVTVDGKAAETNNIFYVGVYTDQACTEQVGDIQPLVMDGNAETKVTFSDLPLNHTYYVAETDSTGKVITDSKEQLGCEMTIENSKISLTKENQTGAAKITNDFPDEEQFYYDGEITVKKTTTYNGKAYNTDDVFYVALFADKAHTKRLTDVKSLEMNGGSKAKVSFENLAYGAYYLAETDKSGKALSDVEAAKLGYTNLFDETVQLDENPVDIELENQMTQEYVKAVQTGDESNMALAVLGLLAALTVMGILAISRKRKNS